MGATPGLDAGTGVELKLMSALRPLRISVIIPAFRAWSTLPSVLEALEPQMGPEREAILVESGERGRSGDLRKYGAWLRVIRIPHRAFPGEARNTGAAHARGDLLAFLDADAVPSADWLDRLERAMTPAVDAVSGAVLNGTPGNRIGTADFLLTFSETLPARPRPIRHAPGANLMVRRRLFETSGGFFPHVRAGEDTMLTFPLARRSRLGFAPDAAVTHLNRTGLRAFLANQRLQGAAFVAVCSTMPYPHRWVCRWPALLLAGPLRLMALGRLLVYNPSYTSPAVRALPAVMLGTIAWLAGAFQARSLASAHVTDTASRYGRTRPGVPSAPRRAWPTPSARPAHEDRAP